MTMGLLGCMASVPRHDAPLPGSHQIKTDLSVQGLRRSYRVHVPLGYDGDRSLPLVVVLHGAFSTAREMEKHSGFSELADRSGFLVVYPEGFGLFGWFQHWNSGHCCGKARKDNLDDVGFVAAVIEDACARLRVDRSRIYMVGNSNGGMLTYRFAAERSETLAAMAVVAGTIGGKPAETQSEWRIPQPACAVPLVAFHGRSDRAVPYEGGRSTSRNHDRTFIAVAESVGFWVKNNGCAPTPVQESLYGDSVARETWSGCATGCEVTLYSIENWDHVWPGRYANRAVGRFEPPQGIRRCSTHLAVFPKAITGSHRPALCW